MKEKLVILVLLIFINISFADKQNAAYPLLPSALEVKNVILCIGDGMGIGQIVATRVKTYGAFGRLNFEKMPVTGLVNTCSADNLITDSGAAGTALATGYKTNNNMIGVNPDGEIKKTILEACMERGMTAGLIAMSTITHATPASFASHVLNRGDEQKIAEHLLKNRVNVLLGGGREFFIPKSINGSKRNDDRDLIKEAKKAGYIVIDNKAGLIKAKTKYLLGLFQLDALNTDTLEPSLAFMTEKAIELLIDQNGFFLMVEGSQIDWECHSNNSD